MDAFTAVVTGAPKDRRDGRAKVTGTARFAAEHRPKDVVHAVGVGSSIAKGELLSLGPGPAMALPGVLLALTPFNAPKLRAMPNFA